MNSESCKKKKSVYLTYVMQINLISMQVIEFLFQFKRKSYNLACGYMP